MSERNPVLLDRPRLKVTARIRSADEHLGRFGGGWQWEVGIQAGKLRRDRGTIMLNLLTFVIRIRYGRRG